MKSALVFLFLVAVTRAFPLAFEKGKRYTFKYRTEVVHSIPGGAGKQIGLRLRCDCQVDMTKRVEAQIKLVNVKVVQLEVTRNEREIPIEAVPQAIALLQKYPAQVVFTEGGQVKTIRVSQHDPEWCRNIKRGIVNMLQVAPKAEGKDPKQILASTTPIVIRQKEQTIVGLCPVMYSVVPTVQAHKARKVKACLVTKTIHYNKCTSRPSIKESIFPGNLCPLCQKSLGYAPYLRHAGQVEVILENRFPLKAMAEETHVFTPTSELGGQIVATVRQRLIFEGVASSPSVEAIESATDASLAFNLVHPEEEVRQNKAYKKQIKAKVEELIKKVQDEAAKDISSHKIPQLVTELVAHLRLCNVPMLENAFNQAMKIKDERAKTMCIDALSLAGTKDVMKLLKKKHRMFKLHRLRRVMKNLVFVPRVTPLHVNTVLGFCQNDQTTKGQLWIRRQCFLTYGALVNRLYKCCQGQQSTEIKNCLQTAIRTLKNKLTQATKLEEKLTLLKAIGNAGLPEHQAAVLTLLMNKKLPNVLRVECVWALRKLVHLNRNGLRSKLIQIFAKPNNHPELRMAVATLMLDKVPTFLNMQLLVNIVRRERQSKGARSNQVASLVISKLFSMAYYDNNVMKERARSARLALRFAPKVQFGLEYSKAMRISIFSDKLLQGFEMEVNKMNVPESYIPRNTNARFLWHFMGFVFDVAEFGARVEGLEDAIEDVLTDIRSRQKRSIWDSVKDFFGVNSENTPTVGPKGQAATVPTTRQTSDEDSTESSLESDENKGARKRAEISMFLKAFGQEILFTKVTTKTIFELVDQIKDLMLGKKKEINTALGMLKITKESIKIQQWLTEAFPFAHARQMVPTLAGLPLHLHVASNFVMHLRNDITIKAKPSWFNFLTAKSVTTIVHFKPKISAFTKAFVKVHTPLIRVGVKMQNTIKMKSHVGFDLDSKFGQSYTLTIQNPTKTTDFLLVSPDPANQDAVGVCGLVETQGTQNYRISKQEVSLQIPKQHMFQLGRTCYGEAITGVDTCLAGRVPNLAAMRFKYVPLFPTILQTMIHIQGIPKDTAKEIQVTVNINKNTNNFMKAKVIYKANGNIRRQVPFDLTYNYNTKTAVLSAAKKAPRTWGMNLRMVLNGLAQIENVLNYYGEQHYRTSLKSTIDQRTGKQLVVTFGWNKLPAYWKEVLKKYEFQILYLLQTLGSMSAGGIQNKLQITFQLTSPLTARLVALLPLGRLQSNKLLLPMRVSRLPLSLQEINEWRYGQCQVQAAGLSNQYRVSIFDRQSYVLNAKQSNCQYILLQAQKKQIRVAVQARARGQLQLLIRIQQPKQATIVVKPNLSVLINNKLCRGRVCEKKGIGKVVRREHRVQVLLNLKHFIEINYLRNRIQILASPGLRNRVRGLCGDNNGEQYQELKSPKGKVLGSYKEFARAWRTGC